jgi:hypothetical protein
MLLTMNYKDLLFSSVRESGIRLKTEESFKKIEQGIELTENDNVSFEQSVSSLMLDQNRFF